MKVVLSIKPGFAEKIFSGEKKFEFRRAIFKDRSVKTVLD
jgi:predicted transcriptional regulator